MCIFSHAIEQIDLRLYLSPLQHQTSPQQHREEMCHKSEIMRTESKTRIAEHRFASSAPGFNIVLVWR